MTEEGNHFLVRLPGNRLKIIFIIGISVLLLLMWIGSAVATWYAQDNIARAIYAGVFIYMTSLIHGNFKNLTKVHISLTEGIRLEEEPSKGR